MLSSEKAIFQYSYKAYTAARLIEQCRIQKKPCLQSAVEERERKLGCISGQCNGQSGQLLQAIRAVPLELEAAGALPVARERCSELGWSVVYLLLRRKLCCCFADIFKIRTALCSKFCSTYRYLLLSLSSIARIIFLVTEQTISRLRLFLLKNVNSKEGLPKKRWYQQATDLTVRQKMMR